VKIANAGLRFGEFGAPPDLNQAGRVVFHAKTAAPDHQWIFTGEGGALTRIVDTGSRFAMLGESPTINTSGTVAFTATATGGESGVYVANGTVTTIATSDAMFADFGPGISLTDTDTVVFRADLTSGQAGIYAAKAGQVTSIVVTGGAFTAIADGASINGAGEVAFAATIPSGSTGIFVGPGAVPNKVILTGETVLGSKVVNVAMGRNALNESGQVAVWVELADGRQALIRADPARVMADMVRRFDPIDGRRAWQAPVCGQFLAPLMPSDQVTESLPVGKKPDVASMIGKQSKPEAHPPDAWMTQLLDPFRLMNAD
jgi:hypothetical protein